MQLDCCYLIELPPTVQQLRSIMHHVHVAPLAALDSDEGFNTLNTHKVHSMTPTWIMLLVGDGGLLARGMVRGGFKWLTSLLPKGNGG